MQGTSVVSSLEVRSMFLFFARKPTAKEIPNMVIASSVGFRV